MSNRKWILEKHICDVVVEGWWEVARDNWWSNFEQIWNIWANLFAKLGIHQIGTTLFRLHTSLTQDVATQDFATRLLQPKYVATQPCCNPSILQPKYVATQAVATQSCCNPSCCNPTLLQPNMLQPKPVATHSFCNPKLLQPELLQP